MITNIFFDLDGTLIDSVPDITSALNEMRQHYQLEPISIETVTSIIGKGFPTTVRRVLGLNFDNAYVEQIADQAINRTKQAYAQHSGKQTRVYAGVVDTLKALQQQGIRMAVVTNKEHKDAVKVLDQCQLTEFFDAIIGGDSTPHYKPHPQPLITAMKMLNATTDNSVMVGDSRNDFDCANSANMRCIMVDYGYANGEDIYQFGAFAYISKFNALLSAIK